VTSSLVTIKKLFWAALFAIVLTGAPFLAERISSQSTIARIGSELGFLPIIPGAFIALIAAMGRFHDIDFRIAEVANAILYFTLAYIMLVAWGRRKTKSIGPPSNENGKPSHLEK
jgi:hypothetical protein